MIWHENLYTGPARLEPGAVCCGNRRGVFFRCEAIFVVKNDWHFKDIFKEIDAFVKISRKIEEKCAL
jgi:hypothetical protein